MGCVLSIVIFITTAISIGFADDEDTVLEVAPFSEVCVQVQNSGMLEQDVVVIFSTGQRSATSETWPCDVACTIEMGATRINTLYIANRFDPIIGLTRDFFCG